MPTRPARRERRRADRRNANKVVDPTSMLPSSPAATSAEPKSLRIFMAAEPVVRTVMRLVLREMEFTISQAVGLHMWKEALEQEKPRLSASSYEQNEYQIMCFGAILEIHDIQLRGLGVLQHLYARQVVLWGLECSKAEEEWDMRFIARRRLELAQLNRMTKRVAVELEKELQVTLGDDQLFASTAERRLFIGALDRFRAKFIHDMKAADKETVKALDPAAL